MKTGQRAQALYLSYLCALALADTPSGGQQSAYGREGVQRRTPCEVKPSSKLSLGIDAYGPFETVMRSSMLKIAVEIKLAGRTELRKIVKNVVLRRDWSLIPRK